MAVFRIISIKSQIPKNYIFVATIVYFQLASYIFSTSICCNSCQLFQPIIAHQSNVYPLLARPHVWLNGSLAMHGAVNGP